MFTQAASFSPMSRSASFSAAARSGRLVRTRSVSMNDSARNERLESCAFPVHSSHMHRVTRQPSGLQFDVEDGESVLAAALRQGYVLPYGCRNGACGSCKGRLVEGTVDYGTYQRKALT